LHDDLGNKKAKIPEPNRMSHGSLAARRAVNLSLKDANNPKAHDAPNWGTKATRAEGNPHGIQSAKTATHLSEWDILRREYNLADAALLR
jgi:hypothetical protein